MCAAVGAQCTRDACLFCSRGPAAISQRNTCCETLSITWRSTGLWPLRRRLQTDHMLRCRVVYVRNLPFNITPEEMYDIFGKFGALRQVRIGDSKETRGTAFVVYEVS